ncbi:MAG: insulinase family protein [Bdellovibrionales bacterium]|nr:insulinase family protein [Bdellovibrionales bacterium]
MKTFLFRSSFRYLILSFLLLTSPVRAFEILLERDSRLPIAYVNVLIRTGSVADPTGKTGVTSFMGEMLLRGTPRHTKEEIDLLLDQWGATLNIETRQEAVVIRGAVLSSNLKAFLELTEEVITSPLFPQSEIDKLKKETLSSILEQQGKDSQLGVRKFNQFLFQGHPYGRPTVGIPSEVSTIDRDLLLKQHRRIFKKELFVILGLGDVDNRVLQGWADNLVSKLPKNGDSTVAITPRPELRGPRLLQIVDKPDRTQTQIFIGQVGVQATDPDYYALSLGNAAFGGGSFSSRLMQEIRVKRGWSYGASSSFRFTRQPNSWTVHLFPAEKDTAAALTATLELIESLRKDGISEKEFQTTKQGAINSAAFLNDTPKKRIENRIAEETLGLERGFYENLAENLKKVSREDVNRALARFLTPDKFRITVVGTADRLKTDLAKATGVPVEKILITPYTSE